MKANLTRDQVATVLRYEPSTGLFYWKRRSANRPAGSQAGSLNDKGYVVICLSGVPYYAHRLAWLLVHGEWPAVEIDHANLVRNDNRIANLRLATRSEQRLNQRINRRNTSGFKGVTWNAGRGKWQAALGRNYLGLFFSPVEAHQAYVRAAVAAGGEFARAA